MSVERKSASVLVVDDDPDVQRVATASLQAAGFEVCCAARGDEALEAWERLLPAVTLLGLQLPGLDGFEVCERIRSLEAGRNAPVVMMTGDKDLAAIGRAYEAGATDFVTRPVEWLVLANRIRYMLRARENLETLDASREQLERAQRIAQIGSWEIERETGRLRASDELRRQAALPLEGQLRSSQLLSLVHPDDQGRVVDAIRLAFRDGLSIDLDHRVTLGSDERFVHLQGEPRFGDGGVVVGVSGTTHDITDRKRVEEQVRYLAYHDSLTGMGNRRAFLERLRLALVQSERAGETSAVLFLDLDRFKSINDTFGHAVGDRVLVGLAQRICDCLRKTDFLARRNIAVDESISRLGGDEFIVLLSSIRRPEDAARVARRLSEAVARPFDTDAGELLLTASIGIAVCPTDGDEPDALIRAADLAMHSAKRAGRNVHRFYSESIETASTRDYALETSLRRGLEAEEFELMYQPKISLETGAVSGVEALIRWNSPDRGTVSPAGFIPVAEDSGLIVPLGAWVLKAACMQQRRWLDAGMAVGRIAVNLSARQFVDGRAREAVREALRDSELAPDRLELEITESLLIGETGPVQAILEEWRAMGVRLSIDDFGTGYSSLSYLKRFPVDVVKIDRSFINGLPDDLEDAALSTAIVSMAKALKLTVIAEGVETEAQRAFLSEVGCDEIQGYLVCRPMPAADFASFVEQRAEPGSHP